MTIPTMSSAGIVASLMLRLLASQRGACAHVCKRGCEEYNCQCDVEEVHCAFPLLREVRYGPGHQDRTKLGLMGAKISQRSFGDRDGIHRWKPELED